jgi:hypothetical protein
MTHRGWTMTASLLALLVAGSGTPARAADAPKLPDLTGDWRLDPKRSDALPAPGGPGGGGGGGGGGHHGGWGGGGGHGGYGGHGGGGGGSEAGEGGGSEHGQGGNAARPVRLPDLMHITQTRTMVSFEDTTGHVLREITTVSAAADTFAHAPGALQAHGDWKGDQLVVERSGQRGKLTETITLEDQGQSLVIHTRVDGNGQSREFKRVYTLVPAS